MLLCSNLHESCCDDRGVNAIVFCCKWNLLLNCRIISKSLNQTFPKIVWTSLKLNAEATNTDSWNLWSLKVCFNIGRRPKIDLNFETKYIWDVPLSISMFPKPKLNPFFQFDQHPVKKMPTYLASRYVCHTNVCQGRSRLFSSFSCNFAKIACYYYFTNCPSKPNCDSYICYNFWTNTYISLLYDQWL